MESTDALTKHFTGKGGFYRDVDAAREGVYTVTYIPGYSRKETLSHENRTSRDFVNVRFLSLTHILNTEAEKETEAARGAITCRSFYQQLHGLHDQRLGEGENDY